MNKSQTMKNSQTVSPNTTSVQGPANLASLTFFSNRRSLFFISLLYFSDSLLICSMRTLTGSFGWLSLIASLILSIPFTLLFGKIFRSAGVGKIFLFLSEDCRRRSHRRIRPSFLSFRTILRQYGDHPLASAGVYPLNRSFRSVQRLQYHQAERLDPGNHHRVFF